MRIWDPCPLCQQECVRHGVDCDLCGGMGVIPGRHSRPDHKRSRMKAIISGFFKQLF